MKFCIDAGHGGKDSGACGNRGTREKDFTLDIAKRVGAKLQKLGHTVVYTRTTDVFIELMERANISNKNNCDLFISIHINSAESKTARGIETFHHPNSSKGKEYATKVQEMLIKRMISATDRGVKTANFAVLRNTNCPAILVECGFISNSDEELLLMSEEYRESLSNAIVEGLTGKVAVPQKDSESHNVSNVKTKYTVNYCLEFQKFFNKVTQTKAPIKEDGIMGEQTKKAMELMEYLVERTGK